MELTALDVDVDVDCNNTGGSKLDSSCFDVGVNNNNDDDDDDDDDDDVAAEEEEGLNGVEGGNAGVEETEICTELLVALWV